MGTCSSIPEADFINGEWKKHKVRDVIDYLVESRFLIDVPDISLYYDFLDDHDYGWGYVSEKSGVYKEYKYFAFLQSPNGKKWLSTSHGKKWISEPTSWFWFGEMCSWDECDKCKYDHEYGSGKKFKCRKCGHDNYAFRLYKWPGLLWLCSTNGQEWLSSDDGKLFLESQTELISNEKDHLEFNKHQEYYIGKFISSKKGSEWAMTSNRVFEGNKSLSKYILNHPDFIESNDFLNTKFGEMWLKSADGYELLTGVYSHAFGKGIHKCMLKVYPWLLSKSGIEWLLTKQGQKYLGTAGGFTYLASGHGINYIEKNIDWLETNDGKRFREYIRNRANSDPEFMTQYFVKAIYEKGHTEYFFPNQQQFVMVGNIAQAAEHVAVPTGGNVVLEKKI